MNDKFKELASLATEYCIEKGVNDAWIWEQKYAELIIRECMDQCNDGDSTYFISQRFGVGDRIGGKYQEIDE